MLDGPMLLSQKLLCWKTVYLSPGVIPIFAAN